MILAYFSKELRNFVVIFRAFGRKCKLWKILRKISKNCQKNFLGQLLKTHYFSMFPKNVIKDAFVFRAFGRKTQFFGKF